MNTNTHENTHENISLTRDVKAIVIPYGDEVTLPIKSNVILMQSLGDAYTVIFEGNMFRISNENADALGKEMATFDEMKNSDASLEDKIMAKLKTCYDPEIPVNIVDLGLIYEITTTEINADDSKKSEPSKNDKNYENKKTNAQTEKADANVCASVAKTASKGKIKSKKDKKFAATVKMTLTAPGCGMGPVIAAEAKQKILTISEIETVQIEMVFDPPWDRSRLSEAAKLMLNM